jgi:hypothetical protein
MREIGYRAIDLLVDRFASLGDQPVIQTASREEMERRLRRPAELGGTSSRRSSPPTFSPSRAAAITPGSSPTSRPRRRGRA